METRKEYMSLWQSQKLAQPGQTAEEQRRQAVDMGRFDVGTETGNWQLGHGKLLLFKNPSWVVACRRDTTSPEHGAPRQRQGLAPAHATSLAALTSACGVLLLFPPCRRGHRNPTKRPSDNKKKSPAIRNSSPR